MRVLVYGAGVIGQIYGGRLLQTGHDVTLLARGRAASLATHGVTLETGNNVDHLEPRVLTAIPDGAAFDVVLVTVRRDQLAGILPAVAGLRATRVAFMLNPGLDLEGRARILFAFPGVGGRRTDDGAIRYIEIRQQKTTVEDRRGIQAPVVELQRSAGFAIDIEPDMAGWLTTHAIFIAAVSAAVLAAGGDTTALAADRDKVADMVNAVGEGFRALQRQSITVTPTALRLIFTVVPRFVAVPYWQRQLQGPVGKLAIAPHARASRETELALLRADVRRLTGGHGPTPHLDRLLQCIGPDSHR